MPSRKPCRVASPSASSMWRRTPAALDQYTLNRTPPRTTRCASCPPRRTTAVISTSESGPSSPRATLPKRTTATTSLRERATRSARSFASLRRRPRSISHRPRAAEKIEKHSYGRHLRRLRFRAGDFGQLPLPSAIDRVHLLRDFVQQLRVHAEQPRVLEIEGGLGERLEVRRDLPLLQEPFVHRQIGGTVAASGARPRDRFRGRHPARDREVHASERVAH